MLKNVNSKAQDVGKRSQKEEILRRRFVGPEKWRNSNNTDKSIGNRGSIKEMERRKILGPQDVKKRKGGYWVLRLGKGYRNTLTIWIRRVSFFKHLYLFTEHCPNVHNFGSMNIKCLTLFVFCHKKRLNADYL